MITKPKDKMKEKENKTKKQGGDRPQVGSGPSYSDSPSDNVNSSIASSPTDTVRTSKNPAAKIVKNLMPILSNIKKFKNNDFRIDYSRGWKGTLIGLRQLLKLRYYGGSNYANYKTSKGILSLRLSDHNANGNNFMSNNINISVFVALIEYPHVFSEVEYTEYKITQETYNKASSRVVFDIITAVERALNGEEFEMSAEIAEKMHVGALPGRF